MGGSIRGLGLDQLLQWATALLKWRTPAFALVCPIWCVGHTNAKAGPAHIGKGPPHMKDWSMPAVNLAIFIGQFCFWERSTRSRVGVKTPR